MTAAPWSEPVCVRLICPPRPGYCPSPAWYYTLPDTWSDKVHCLAQPRFHPNSFSLTSPIQSIRRAPGAPLMFSRKLYPGSPALMRHRHSPERITPEPNTLKFARLQGSHLSIAYLVPGLVQWLLARRSQIPVNAPRSCTCCPAPDSRPELQWPPAELTCPTPTPV